jgi:hypothetical protein
MPRLINRRHEWFAHLRAHGMRLEEAYENAGYAPDRGHACRLASRPDVAARINELRSDFTDIRTAERPRVIDALMAIGESSRSHGTTSGLKEARFAYLEAARLQQQHAEDLSRDRDIIERELGDTLAGEREAKVAESEVLAGEWLAQDETPTDPRHPEDFE